MKKEDFVAIGISEELAEKAAQASAAELKGFVPKSRFDEVNQAKGQLETSANDYKTQLDSLKASAGDNEALKQQIAALQAENQQKEADYLKQMKELKITNAVKLAVASIAQDSDIVAGLIDRNKVILGDDGNVTGLEEQVKSLKENKPFLFKEEKQKQGTGFQIGASQQSQGSGQGGQQLSMRDAIRAKLQSQMDQS